MVILLLKDFWILPMLLKWSNDLVVKPICSRWRKCIWSEWTWFSDMNFFLLVGWTNLRVVSPVYLRIWYGGLQISILQLRAHCKVFKIHIDSLQLWGGNCYCHPCFLSFLFRKLLSKQRQIFCNDTFQPNSNYEFHH